MMMNSARTEAIQTARNWLARSPVFLDTETTGTDRAAEILEICLLDQEGNVLLESLVRPTIRIPMDAQRIHGIRDSMVQGAPTWLQVWPRVDQLLTGRALGIYNAEFDLRLMQQSHSRLGMRWPASLSFTPFCIMRLYAQYVGEWNRIRGGYRWHSLEDAGRQCQIPLPNSHRARDDTLLAIAVLKHIASSSI